MKQQHKREKIASELKNWRKEQAEAYKTYVKTSAVGLEFGLAIAIGALIGYFLDKYFETSPYCLIGGVIAGSIAAVKRIWLFSKSYIENNKSDDK